MNVIARVVDCAPPALDGMPADIVLEAVAPDGADLLYVAPTATDAIDAAVAVDCDVASSSRVPIGVTTVTCSATDRAGNVASGTFTVSVVDTTAPTLDGMPAGIAVTALDVGGASVDWPMPTASDAVDGAPTVTCDPSPASLFAVGSTTVTCSATDAAGNVASASFDLLVSASPDPDPVPEETPSGTSPGAVDNEEPRQDSAGGGRSAAAQGSVPGVLPDTSMPATSAAAPVVGVLLVALVAVSAVLRRRPA
jgi:hypothetical protein